MTSTILFEWCKELIVSKDFGYGDRSNYGYGDSYIVGCECKRESDNLPCLRKGKCITARGYNTTKPVNLKKS